VISVIAVFIGGVLGTGLRFLLGAAVPESAQVVTMAINVVGSFALGLLVSTVWAKASTPPWLKAGLGTGLLGGFTTFSAVALDIADTLPSLGTESTSWALGMLVFYLVEIIIGILAAWAGLALGARASRGRVKAVDHDHSVITDDGGDL
jgi:CrcB protein